MSVRDLFCTVRVLISATGMGRVHRILGEHMDALECLQLVTDDVPGFVLGWCAKVCPKPGYRGKGTRQVWNMLLQRCTVAGAMSGGCDEKPQHCVWFGEWGMEYGACALDDGANGCGVSVQHFSRFSLPAVIKASTREVSSWYHALIPSVYVCVRVIATGPLHLPLRDHGDVSETSYQGARHWRGMRTRVGVSPEHRSTAVLLSVPAALLCVSECDSVRSTVALSVACLSERQHVCSCDETCTHSASRCICIRIGYLLVLVPQHKCVRCVCVFILGSLSPSVCAYW